MRILARCLLVVLVASVVAKADAPAWWPQESAVRRAYRLRGFRLARRLERGDWSILWLRRR